MYTLLIILHVIVAVCLIISVLMQSSKGEGLAGAFGGGTFSSTVFGGRGAATFLARATSVLALVFALTSIGLTMVTRAPSSQSAVQKAAGTIPMPQQQAPVNVQQGQNAQPPAGQPAQTGQPAEPNVFDPNAPGSQKQTEPKSSTPK
ncbi:MAG: preprotein translocase subunit SecG [candidate division Zixibacteria bacterium]|nr:preprotein translocase subunit SecG [candidate division Zixibacteria bacterium]